MHCPAVVAERFLREAFGITRGLSSLGPGVAIAVQRDAVDFESDTGAIFLVAHRLARPRVPLVNVLMGT